MAAPTAQGLTLFAFFKSYFYYWTYIQFEGEINNEFYFFFILDVLSWGSAGIRYLMSWSWWSTRRVEGLRIIGCNRVSVLSSAISGISHCRFGWSFCRFVTWFFAFSVGVSLVRFFLKRLRLLSLTLAIFLSVSAFFWYVVHACDVGRVSWRFSRISWICSFIGRLLVTLSKFRIFYSIRKLRIHYTK